MVTKWIRWIFPIVFSISFLILPFFVNIANAASGSISVVPKNGSYSIGDTFEVNIKVDGGGEAFNAVKANVSISENLKIQRLTLGDCGFAFVQTPTVSSPSFAGVILGGSKNSCTVYSISLIVTAPNNAFVYLSDGSIKSYNGANEIMNKVENSSYTVSSSSQGNEKTLTAVEPTHPPITSADGEKMYSLVYTISADPSKSSDIVVVLDPNLPTQMQSQVSPALQDRTVLSAVFDNVDEGVHTIEVREGGNILSSEVVNLSGDNREINLGVQPKNPPVNLLVVAVAALGIIILLASLVLGYVYYMKKRQIPS